MRDSKIITLENSEIKNKNIYLGHGGYNQLNAFINSFHRKKITVKIKRKITKKISYSICLCLVVIQQREVNPHLKEMINKKEKSKTSFMGFDGHSGIVVVQ